MPALLTTQLVDETPVVAIIGTPSAVTTGVERLFIDASFEVHTFLPEEIENNNQFLNTSWYKVVWINSPDNWKNKKYLTICKVLNSVVKPQLVIIPITSTISETELPEDSLWFDFSRVQTQVLVDCNYYLQTATFIFARDLIDTGSTPAYTSSLDFLTKDLNSHQLLLVRGEIYPQLVSQFLNSLSSLLFRTNSSLSTQVLGKKIAVKDMINQVKKEYQAYHAIELSVYNSPAEVCSPIPFSTHIQESISDGVVTAFTRSLPVITQPEEKPDFSIKTLPNPQYKTQQHRIPSLSKTPVLLEKKTSEEEVRDDLQKIFQTNRGVTKTTHVQELVKVHTVVKKKTKRKTSLFYLGIGTAGVGLGILFLTALFFYSTFLLNKELAATVLQSSVQDFSYTKQLKTIAKLVRLQVESYSAVFSLPQLTQAAQSAEMAEKITELFDTQQELKNNQTKTTQVILGQQQDESRSVVVLSNLVSRLAQSHFEKTSYLQGLFDFSEHLTDQEGFKAFQKKLELEKNNLLITQQVFSLFPTLIPEQGRKTYAVLLQNDQELRPTGGFIQAVGFITFENGALTSVTTKSSYELDKLVLGSVEPPPEITQYLGEKRLYLRDSNWNPDFPTSAKQIQWFIEQATNQQLAGILAVNTRSLSILLEALGPVELSEFNEVLTAKNIQERMEFHSEVVLVESSNLPDYSSFLLKRVLEQLPNLPADKVGKLGSAVVKAAKQQQLLLFSVDQDVQSAWRTLGWSGGILSPSCPTQLATVTCLVEPVAQIETNVGINKANYYLEREIQHQVILGSTVNTHKRTITYVNTAQSEAWPKGPYKSYVRFLLPKGSENIEASVSGSPVPNSQLRRWSENDRVGVGFYFEVPTQQSREVFVSFTTPHEHTENYSYVFFDQKQSGTADTPFSLELVNQNSSPLLVASQAEVREKSVIFSQKQDSHLFFGAQY